MSTPADCTFCTWLRGGLLSVVCLTLVACQSHAPLSESQVKRADLRLQLASAYLERGQPDVALIEAQRALDIDPDNARAHNVLAMALMDLQRFDAAQQAMAHAAALAPNDLQLQHNLAWAQCAAGRTDQALRTFDQVLVKASPDFDAARTQLSKGVCAMQAQRLDVARQALLLAQHDPRYADAARFSLVKLMVQLHDWPYAMRVLSAMPDAQRATPAVQALQADVYDQFERSKQRNTPTND